MRLALYIDKAMLYIYKYWVTNIVNIKVYAQGTLTWSIDVQTVNIFPIIVQLYKI